MKEWNPAEPWTHPSLAKLSLDELEDRLVYWRKVLARAKGWEGQDARELEADARERVATVERAIEELKEIA